MTHNVVDYSDPAALKSALNANLTPLEEKWGRGTGEDMPPTRFLGLIRRACEKTGKKVVVLIDEYDKPLLQHIETDQF